MKDGRASRPILLVALSLGWAGTFFVIALLSLAAASGGRRLFISTAMLAGPAADLAAVAGEAMLCAVALCCLSVGFLFSWSVACAAASDADGAGALLRIAALAGSATSVIVLAAGAGSQPNLLVPLGGSLLLLLALTSLVAAVESETRHQHGENHFAPAHARLDAREAARLAGLPSKRPGRDKPGEAA